MDAHDIAGKLQHCAKLAEFSFGVAARCDGTVVAIEGSLTAAGADGLYDALFGDREAIVDLCASLDGQLEPRIWSQGRVRCAVYRPEPGVVLGVFVESDKTNADLYREFAALKSSLQ